MMFQPLDKPEAEVEFNDRPDRPRVIQNDEVVDLRIDLETLEMDEIYAKYFHE